MNQISYKIRKCDCENNARLKPISHQLELYNSVTNYQCDTCGKDVQFTPMASIGVLMTVGVLAIGILYFMFITGKGGGSSFDYAIMAIGVAALAFVTIPPIRIHFHYPIDENAEQVELDGAETNSKHLLAKPISFIEGFGFISGLIAPIVIIALILGIATLIGYINFTYFG